MQCLTMERQDHVQGEEPISNAVWWKADGKKDVGKFMASLSQNKYE